MVVGDVPDKEQSPPGEIEDSVTCWTVWKRIFEKQAAEQKEKDWTDGMWVAEEPSDFTKYPARFDVLCTLHEHAFSNVYHRIKNAMVHGRPVWHSPMKFIGPLKFWNSGIVRWCEDEDGESTSLFPRKKQFRGPGWYVFRSGVLVRFPEPCML
jgi:hypothetical protein